MKESGMTFQKEVIFTYATYRARNETINVINLLEFQLIRKM
jgi:hypothetical protein